MATIPSFAEWTSKTALGAFKPRSTELKNVDVALKQFETDRNGTSLKALSLAWNAWKRSKGDWRASERNKEHILEQLNDGIRERLGPLGGGMTAKEKEAMVYWDQQRRLAVQRMFKGRKVKLKLLNPTLEAGKALNELKTVATPIVGATGGAGGSAAAAAVNSIKSMLTDFFDVASVEVISPLLMHTFGTDLVASMTPIVGHIKSAGSVLVSWGTLGKRKYEEVSNRQHKYFIGGGGDASKAFDALQQLLMNEVGNATVDVSMKTSAFAARSLLALADGGTISGPVVGAAEALAKLTFRIYQLAGEYKETRKANKLLEVPDNLDFKLFDAYPLLGCHMLASATLSDIMNMTMVEFGEYGWKDDVEFIKKKHIDPVRKQAFDLIYKSIFEIEGVSPLVQASKMDKAMKVAKLAM